MNNDVPLDFKALRIGVEETHKVILEAKPDSSTEELRRAVAPMIFHQASANLRNGPCAGMDPELWWQVAETVQYTVDWWVMTGDLYQASQGVEG